MRVLHTSDWHLGRSFHQVGLLDAQARFVDFLVALVRAERIGAVLVAGDVYDRALPSPDTVALLDEALTRLVDAGAAVVMSSGNHDSAIRLGFGAGLFGRAGVHIRSSPSSVGSPVLLDGLTVYPLPFLEPSVVAATLRATERSHAAVLAAAMARVHADLATRSGPSVVMAHAFVAGGAASDSERDIAVGGVGVVPASLFDGVSYAALGHLHRAQQLSDRVGYCGSPLAMSFGEAGQTKAVTLLQVGADGSVAREAVATPVPRVLARLRGDLQDLLVDPAVGWAEPAWCEIVLTDATRQLGAFDRLRRRFPHLLSLDFDPQGASALPARRYAGRAVSSRSPLEVCCDFLAHVRGGAAATAAERAALNEALDATRVDGVREEAGKARATESVNAPRRVVA
ncbi:MAG: exonuclease SbcCD subunit D [Actinomycetales bacterium]|nr:exonuclease SbcCD subunit D [Actinomycetales bacterium]